MDESDSDNLCQTMREITLDEAVSLAQQMLDDALDAHDYLTLEE
tara:strand:- start:50 stop:181 length:132 start_codon:yes stop_codon:yes gene_type:complete